MILRKITTAGEKMALKLNPALSFAGRPAPAVEGREGTLYFQIIHGRVAR